MRGDQLNLKSKYAGWARRAVVFGAAFLVLFSCQKPPMTLLESAKLALRQAENSGALRYAEQDYRAAEAAMRSGWMEIARQNGRLAPFRNYHNADSLLRLSIARASDTVKKVQETIAGLDSLSRNEREHLKNELTNWREALDGSLENFRAEKYWTEAEFAIRVSENLAAHGEYQESIDAVKKGRGSLRKLEETITEYINDQARKIQTWRQWVRETVNESQAAGTSAIIIDKSAHKTYLVKSGKIFSSYDCELGYNSAHQKLFAGDGATPEGQYQITKVKYNSKFHRALLINFPNSLDIRRFRENKSKGIISRYARVGALIEIHGNGGKKEDWTDGCVALSNNDMDHLLQYVEVGTPVTIVRKSDQWP
jgi:L,D-peptidoglycan transpeptidase YkuD (ErfK/YbiS/YcfS/YnhG family)